MITTDRAPVCDEHVRRYLRQIASFPMLTREEEIVLGRRWRRSGDIEAAHRLTASHLRLAAKIALRYAGNGVPASDLISEGNVGLIRAVHGFDPDRGFRLASYAIPPIKAAIQDHVMFNWSLVKIGTTPLQRKLFFRLRCLQVRTGRNGGEELAHEEVSAMATSLALPAREVATMNLRVSRRDHALGDDIAGTADESPGPEVLCAEREEDARRKRLFITALRSLTARECRILTERRLTIRPATLETLARAYGISPERIRQIEASALERIRTIVGKRPEAWAECPERAPPGVVRPAVAPRPAAPRAPGLRAAGHRRTRNGEH